MHVWAIRATALVILILVLWLAGPRAWVVLSAELAPAPGPAVDLDRVGLAEAPSWLRQDPVLQISVFMALSPKLRGGLPQRDRARAASLCGRLQSSPWVRSAQLMRREHGATRGFALDLELRRPVLWLEPVGYARGQVDACLVDAEGICMPLELAEGPPQLPRFEIGSGVQAGSLPVYVYGKKHPRPEVLAAAAVAREWREEIVPRVSELPPLELIDARRADLRGDRELVLGGQVLLGLRRPEGGQCLIRYGYAPGVPFVRQSAASRAAVLEELLAAYPGLSGLQRADLRYPDRWQQGLLRSAVQRDPGK